jgi:AraC-like DNA-binding protein/ligand-binding sensor protein
MTGLTLALRAVETWRLPHHDKHHENPFCAMLAETSRACAACLQVQQELAETATHAARTVVCGAGLSETAVPVRMGDQLIGFLTTGQVFGKKPTEPQFKRTVKLLAEWGVPTAAADWREMYFATRVVAAREHASVVKLLTIFAQHLSLVSNQVFVQEQYQELPLITRAKAFIRLHQREKLTLNQVAQAVNASTFYLCKVFKKAAGMHFTDYVARVRTEQAKLLLLNPNLRVSEIAFETGFQSLTHFNRVFKRILGRSPTDYRGQLARA